METSVRRAKLQGNMSVAGEVRLFSLVLTDHQSGPRMYPGGVGEREWLRSKQLTDAY